MIYLKSDGSKQCNKLIDIFYKELSDTLSSVFNTGEAVERIDNSRYGIDKHEGTKVIDFTFIKNLLQNKVVDINHTDYISWIEPALDDILTAPREIDYCILVPNLERNDPESVRSKVVNDIRVKLHGKCKIKRVPSFYNSHKSNPYQFILNDHQVSLLSVEKELTQLMQGVA